jgi:hypothetical protein
MKQQRLMAIKKTPIRQIVKGRLRGFEMRQLARLAKRANHEATLARNRGEQITLF